MFRSHSGGTLTNKPLMFFFPFLFFGRGFDGFQSIGLVYFFYLFIWAVIVLAKRFWDYSEIEKRNHTKRALTRWKYESVSQTSPQEKLCRRCSQLTRKQTGLWRHFLPRLYSSIKGSSSCSSLVTRVIAPFSRSSLLPNSPSLVSSPSSLLHSASSATQRYFCWCWVQWQSEQSRGGTGALLVSGLKGQNGQGTTDWNNRPWLRVADEVTSNPWGQRVD